MICNYCSQENPDNSVFCKNCGKRIDGKKVCPRCKALVDDTAVFCNMCGARMDGKTVCAKCGTAYEGNFCPDCGASTNAVKIKGAAGGSSTQWKTVLSKVGLSIGFAGAVFAFIFMFFIGISMSVGATGSAAATINGMENIADFTLFDCFGNNFNFISELDAMSEYTGVVSTIYYFYAVMKLIIATATVVCTITFFIFAIYRFVNTMLGKQTKSAENMIFATIISFVAGALSFKTLVYMQLNATTSAASASVGYAINDATVAGIVISLVFAAIMLGFKSAVIASSLRKTILLKTIISGICTIFALTLLLSLTGQITFSETTSSGTMKMTTGFALILGGALSKYSTYSSYYADQSTADTALFIGIAGHIITFAFIIMLAVFIVYSAIKTIDDKEKSSAVGIVYSSILLAFTIAFMVFSILGKNILIDMLNPPSSVIFRLTALPYLGIVMALIMLAAEITYVVMKNRFNSLSNGNTAAENS